MLKKNLIESQKESKLMEKMDTAEPNFEQLFEEKKRVRNPLVPVGKYSINPPLPFPPHFFPFSFYIHLLRDAEAFFFFFDLQHISEYCFFHFRGIISPIQIC